MDFLAMTAFAIAGLLFLITLVPFPDFTTSSWYQTTHDFWITYIVKTGMQLSSWLPVNAIANIFQIFLTILASLITFNIARLILNLITGGGTK